MTVKRKNHGRNHSYWAEFGATDPKTGGPLLEKLPGVTTIIGDTVPKDALVDWAARSGADELVNYWDELLTLTLMQRHERVRTAYQRDRDKAARRGTEVHRFAERASNDELDWASVPEELRGHVESYGRFLEVIDPSPLIGGTELVVASRKHRYCGTADLVADLPSVAVDAEIIAPCRWLLEIKTTRSGVWPESALQATAYSRAEIYVHPDKPDDELPMSQLGIQRCGVVWVGSDSWELRPVTADESVWEFFLHLRWLYDQLEPGTRGKRLPRDWIGSAAAPGPADLLIA